MNLHVQNKNVMLMKSIKIFLKTKFICFYSYWERKSEYTPESRIETHETMKKKRERESKEFVFKNKKKERIISFIFYFSYRTKTEPKPVRQYIGDDGRPLNCNEPKYIICHFYLIENLILLII